MWIKTARELDVGTLVEARARLKTLLRIGEAPEPLPRNKTPRPALDDVGDRSVSEIFESLRSPPHRRAAWILNQLYLAMPNPDANWAGDCQTKDFHTRMGAHVRKGETGSTVVYANRIVRTETDDVGEGLEQRIPFLKVYTVFKVEQIDDLPDA